MILMLGLAVICILNASFCLKQRKFYKQNSVEMRGTVIAWNKRRVEGDQMNPEHYLLIVQCGEELYYIESTHSRARKYKEGREVSILVIPHEPFPELPPEMIAEMSPETLEKYEQIRESEPKMKAFEKRLTILKDDHKTMAEAIFCIIAGIVFALLAVVQVMDIFR